jgi:NADH-quinone oxidoreductase subunit J
MNLAIAIGHWILAILLLVFSSGIILAKKPIYSCLSFLFTLVLLATVFIELSAEFIGVMQIFVYAGSILVIFVFVIVLFQDAYEEIDKVDPQSSSALLTISILLFLVAFLFIGFHFTESSWMTTAISDHFGSVQDIGKALYVDGFFPFEAVVVLFLVSIVGTLYIAKKEV